MSGEMTTGDIKNNLRKLQSLLRQVAYKEDVDYDGMSKGLPTAFLPIYHYTLTSYSRHLAAKLSEMNVHLMGTADLRFVDLMYRVLRDLFGYKPGVPKEKFFSAGFAERKVIMCTEVVSKVQKFHKDLEPRKVVKKTADTSVKPDISNIAESTLQSQGRLEPKLTTDGRPASRAPTYSQVTKSSLKAPSKETKRPKSAPVAPRSMTGRPSAYAPSAYGPVLPAVQAVQPVVHNHVSFAEDGPDVTDLPVVEVVRMNGPSDNLDEQLRPIDIVAQTPARPGPRTDLRAESLLTVISQRMDDLAARLQGMEDRVVTMETTLSNQCGNQGAGGATPVAPPSAAGQTETMLARLTLVEARLKGVESKIAATHRSGPVIAGPTAEQWVNGDSGVQTITAGLPNGNDITASSDTVSATELDQAMLPTSSHMFLDSVSVTDREESGASCSPIEPRKMPKVVPSPIVTDLIRQVVRENGSDTSESTPRVSTPTEVGGDQSLSAAFTNLSNQRREQALRIENMLKNTKETLTHS